MAKREQTTKSILKLLLKNFTSKHTITSIARAIGVTRTGVWKVLKEMESKKLVRLSPIGPGKTSTYSVSINWDNVLAQKELEIALTEEALRNPRWLNNFSELEKEVEFLLIYGSIIHSPKEANDVDILSVVSGKKMFSEIEKSVSIMQKTQLKRIHALNLTLHELKEELTKPNKVFVDAIQKGIILFGQDRFVRFMREMDKND